MAQCWKAWSFPKTRDMPGLYKYINEIYKDTVVNKKSCSDLMRKMYELNTRVDTILNQFQEFKSNIAGRVLGIEIKLENNERKKGYKSVWGA